MKPQYGGKGPKKNRPQGERPKGPFGPRGGSAVGPGLAQGGGTSGSPRAAAAAAAAPGPFVKTGSFNKKPFGKPAFGGKPSFGGKPAFDRPAAAGGPAGDRRDRPTFGKSSAYAANPRGTGARPPMGGGGGGAPARRPQPSFKAGPPKPAATKPAAPRQGTGMPTVAAKTDWADVADWYDQLVGDQGSEYHQKVVFPGVLRLLAAGPADPVLDVACGQGALCRLLAAKGVPAVGVDSAEPLVAAARGRGPDAIAYHVGDVRDLAKMPFVPANHFAAAACLLALQNIHPITGVFGGVAKALRPGGRFVLVMMHPCFRGPKETGWMWDETAGTQFRRVDRYLSPRKEPIVTHPGSDPGGYTWTFHKPLEHYVRAARGAGLLVDAIEEWPSHKTSQPGPRAAAENRAREEIPMFMAIRCVKVAVGAAGEKDES